MVQQPIQDRGRNDRIAEHLAPRAEALIARQNEGAPFIATRDELEEQVGPLPINRDIPDFIDAEDLRLREQLEFFRPTDSRPAPCRDWRSSPWRW